jgi:hypothetical protein
MAKRKRLKSKREESPKVLEYKGWKSGDRCYTVFSGESKPSLCDILHFHPDDSVTPSVSVTEVSTGKYRAAAVRAISDTAKGAKELKPKWDKYYAKWKRGQDKRDREARRTEQKTKTEQNTSE